MQVKEVHTFEANGTCLVVDVETSAIYRIDDLTKYVLDAFRTTEGAASLDDLMTKYGRDRINDVVVDLRSSGIIGEQLPKQTSDRGPDSTYLTDIALNISHRCNLRCRYCYGGGGSYGGRREQMAPEIARQAIDLLVRESGDRPRCTVMFFGGEPLLNLPLIRDCVPYARRQADRYGKRITFSTVTNGTLLTEETLDILDRERVWVEVSIDGLPDAHDDMRVYADGRGSYDDTVAGIRRLTARRPNLVPARATVTHGHLHFMESVKHLIGLGFGSVAVDIASGSGDGWSITADDIDGIEQEYEKTARYLLEKIRRREPFGFSSLTSLVEAAMAPDKKVYHCGCGKNYMAVAPDGAIYACHRFVGNESFRMGNVAQGIDKQRQMSFLANRVDNRDECRDCWARYFCGGGCNYQAVQATGSIERPDPLRCRLTRRMVELALMIYADLHETDRDLLTRAAELARRPRGE